MRDNSYNTRKFDKNFFYASPTDPILIIDDFYVDMNSDFYDIHYDYEVGVVVEGALTGTFRGEGKTLLPGDIWVAGIWEPHGFELEEIPSEIVCFILLPESLNKILPIGFDWVKIFSKDSDSTPKIDDVYKPLILQACSEIKEVVSRNSMIALAWKANIITRILLYVVESNIEVYSKIHQQNKDMVDHNAVFAREI